MFRGEAFPENTVVFELYPDFPEAEDPEEVLLKTLTECDSICKEDVAQYFWHYDTWALFMRADGKGSDFVPHLEGTLCFGDSVEDEWFVVWVLFKLTKFIPGLIARVYDSDGEILLIQAADHLPRWLDEHDAKNRVFIYQGEVHIVPIPTSPAEITPVASSKDPCLADSLSAVRSYSSATRASRAIQETVLQRFEGFPGRMEAQLHRANVIVPAGVAALLNAHPSLLAPAVHAFCERDPLDMKACRAMKFFPPEQCVKTRVTFTRCLYAMLNRARCDPDPRTGWKLPNVNSPDRVDAELGVKLAWGFEILAASLKPEEGEKETVASVENDERWPKYIESLKKHGYFKGELEGSTEHDRLMSEAVEYFVTHIRGSTDASGGPVFSRRVAAGREIHRLLSTIDVDLDELKKKAGSLPPSDDDSWLNVGAEDLDKMLKEHFMPGPEGTAPGQNIPDSLRLFLSQVSSFDGVENGARKRSTAGRKVSRHSRKTSAVGPDGRKVSAVSTVSNLSEMLTFDGDKFNSALRDILDLDDAESEGSFDSEWSDEYGSESDFDEALTNGAGTGGRKISHEQREIMRIMAAMDEEIMAPGKTSLGESFVRKDVVGDKFKVYSVDEAKKRVSDGEDIDTPVDIDLNAMKNILESFESQHGLPGPASTLLSSIRPDH